MLEADQFEGLKKLLFDLVPSDGSAIGNVSLRGAFQSSAKQELGLTVSDDVYWEVRNAVVSDGLIETGRGKGGSVHRIKEMLSTTTTTTTPPPTIPCGSISSGGYGKESDLYDPFHTTIRRDFAKVYGLTQFVSQITANEGKKMTGGKWTRPDVTMIAVRAFQFVPGKFLEVITFEVKPFWETGVEGVFEAASHSSFATKSFVALHAPKQLPDTDQERLEDESNRFGLGLILFSDPSDWSTFDIVLDPRHHPADPGKIDAFLTNQLSDENKRLLMPMTK